MKNYLDYFVPKYQNTPGPLPEIEERNGIYYINGRVVGEKPVSGKDPLLSLWVEGTALGKPLEWAGRGLWAGAKFVAPKTTSNIVKVGKTVKEAIKNRLKIKSNNIPSGQLVKGNKIITDASGRSYQLPEYANPNTDPNIALELTQQRIENGGRERLKQSILEGSPEQIRNWENANVTINGSQMKNDISFYDDLSAIREPVIVSDSKTIGKSLGSPRDPESLGGAIPQQGYWIYSDSPKNLPGTAGQAHEFAHYYHTPVDRPEVNENFIEWLGKEYGQDGVRYFKNLNSTEISARGTQLKNYFGLKEGQKITPEMWEYAKQNYIKDMGYDNTMSEFFQLPTKEQLPDFLNWLNKNAPTVVAPVLIGTTTSGGTYKYQNGNKLRQIAPYLDKEKFNKLFQPLRKTNKD